MHCWLLLSDKKFVLLQNWTISSEHPLYWPKLFFKRCFELCYERSSQKIRSSRYVRPTGTFWAWNSQLMLHEIGVWHAEISCYPKTKTLWHVTFENPFSHIRLRESSGNKVKYMRIVKGVKAWILHDLFSNWLVFFSTLHLDFWMFKLPLLFDSISDGWPGQWGSNYSP